MISITLIICRLTFNIFVGYLWLMLVRFTICLEALNSFSQKALPYISMGYCRCYPLCDNTFMGVLFHFQHTTIISLLSNGLVYVFPYIFIEVSTYLYHFQRVTTRYHCVFKKEV